MPKYSKGVKIYKLKILVTDKDSFDECNKSIIQELSRCLKLNEKEKEQIIKEVLS